MSQEFDWSVPQLSPEDQRLVDTYKSIGRPFEDLPYTDDFDRLCEHLGVAPSNNDKHQIYKRLYILKYSGRLPRVSTSRFVSGGQAKAAVGIARGIGTLGRDVPESDRP